MQFATKLSATEPTGSEILVHLDYCDEHRLDLIHGVHDLELGKRVDVWHGPHHANTFGEGCKLIASAVFVLSTNRLRRNGSYDPYSGY